jgi:putative transposase
MDGEVDFVDLLVQYRPKVPVASLLNSLKDVFSRLLRQQRPDVRKRYWKGALWSRNYFASTCGGALINFVRQYIEPQKMPD